MPLDIPAMLAPRDGRTPVRVFYLAHLPEAQRTFFLTLLLHAVVAWTRRLSGTADLRALLYLDEVFGTLPPHPRDPPTKEPLLRLMKQARSVGVGVMLATQTPVDLDYKALSNADTWLVGRLQTPQDRERVLHGLTAAGLDQGTLNDGVARLPKRTFVWRGVDGRGGVVHSRHTMSWLRGPLTRAEVTQVAAPGRAQWVLKVAEDERPARPMLADGVATRWLAEVPAELKNRLALPAPSNGARTWRAALLTRVSVRFDEVGWAQDTVIDWWVGPHALALPAEDAAATGVRTSFEPAWLHREAPEDGAYGTVPRWLDEPADVSAWKRVMVETIVRQVVAPREVDGEERMVRAERGDVRVTWVGVVWV